MPAPISKNAASRPSDLDDIVDRTMELDMRWLQYEGKEEDEKPSLPRADIDDPTVVLDLTATQVHDLLTTKKK